MTEEKHIKALELDKILNMLSALMSIDDSRPAAAQLRPADTLYGAQTLMNRTEAAYKLLAKFGSPSFGAAKNVNSALYRASSGGILTFRELLDIGENLRVIRSLYEWRFGSKGSESCLDIFFSSLIPNRALENSIFVSILSEEEMADTASKELAEIRKKIRACTRNIREKLEGLIRSSYYKKYLQDALITQRNGRFVVPVKNEFRNEVSGLVHDTSGSGATVFIEPMAVVEANNEIRVLRGKEKEEIERILISLSTDVGENSEILIRNFEALTELDLIFAKAQLAYQMKASVPKLNTAGIIKLKRARHPLLDPKKAVPIDISLGEDFDTLVITGPNTGGKTVSIKTIGLLTLMAECGLMTPADDFSEICIFKNVFADIGDEQSIEQSLSTFSSHMVNLVDILKKADGESLVLIDELGAGTDPVEGAALAMAILKNLQENGAKTAATTHYAELKAYALEAERVENGSCEFDLSTLCPTFRLLIGIPGRSNAFAISEKLGLDARIIEMANKFLTSENRRFENVVDSLERSRLELENEKKLAGETIREYGQKLSEAEKKLAETENIRQREFEKARSDALKISEKARREASALLLEAENLRKELKASDNSAETVKKARLAMKKGLSELDAAVDPVSQPAYEDSAYVLPRPLKVGDTVFLTRLGKEATVLSGTDKKGFVKTLAGAVQMRVRESELRLIENKKDKKRQPALVTTDSFEKKSCADASKRCDLRGMTVDEAENALDIFLDSMLLAGIDEFTVIHGKGTGALRSAVQRSLKVNKFVKEYRLGVYGEGGDGVTMVKLK